MGSTASIVPGPWSFAEAAADDADDDAAASAAAAATARAPSPAPFPIPPLICAARDGLHRVRPEVDRGRGEPDREEHRDVPDEPPGEPSFLDRERVVCEVHLEPIPALHLRRELAQQEPEHRERLHRLDQLHLHQVLALLVRVEVARVHAVREQQEGKDERRRQHEGRAPAADAEKHSPSPPRHVPPLPNGVQIQQTQRPQAVALDGLVHDDERVLRLARGREGGFLRARHVDALLAKVPLQILLLALPLAGRGAARHAPAGDAAAGRREETRRAE
jgi:hypothetical protein